MREEEPTVRGGARLLVAGALAVAALSLLLPSTPTYDPWSWIIWGREITQLDLETTTGPSWKPLPVLFTTVFALFGDAAPSLWLVVARAGFVVSIVLAFLVARRLGGGWAGGLAAAGALAAAPWGLRNAALGNSEPLLVALLLGAVERWLAGDRRAAFLLGVGAGLLRPEAWPFLGLVGVWALWRRVLSPRLVVGSGLMTVALWTLPEWWGSGDPLRAMSRAQDPNPGAAAFADDPVARILSDAEAMLVIPVEAGLVAAVALAAVRRDRALAALLLLAAGWLGLVAAMTAGGGFSGNQRYLIPPVALCVVAAGAGAGWVLARLRVPAAVAAVLLVGTFVATSVSRMEPTVQELDYQAQLAGGLEGLVERAGGADALLRCGRPYTGPFLVPAVAWHLGVHSERVALEPERPAVVFRVRTIERSRPVPTLRRLDASGPPPRTLAVAPGWRVVAACDPGA